MQGDTIQMQPLPKPVAETDRRAGFLGNVFGAAFALLSTRLRQSSASQPDGLEALDMLGGWQGSDRASRRSGR